jgi:hypothetical protein
VEQFIQLQLGLVVLLEHQVEAILVERVVIHQFLEQEFQPSHRLVEVEVQMVLRLHRQLMVLVVVLEEGEVVFKEILELVELVVQEQLIKDWVVEQHEITLVMMLIYKQVVVEEHQ